MANDLGTQIVDFLLTDEIGVILLAFTITTIAKIIWRRKLAEMFGDQFEDKKYIIFGIFTGIGIVLWLVGDTYIVKAFGLALVGVSLASICGEAWEDHIYPFIQTNTWKVILTSVGIALFLFAGTLEEIFGFPFVITIIISIIIVAGCWFGTVNRGYKAVQTKYPSMNVTETIKEYL